MRYVTDNSMSIGHTPVVRLNHIVDAKHATVLAKIEGRNPAYSVKCRIGASMIWDAEEKGLLGATEYVKAHEEEVVKNGIICMNFDMNDVNLERVDTLETEISNGNYREKLVEIKNLMLDKYPELKKYNINITAGGGGPDGAPFFKRGIDASFAMGEWGSSWEFHTEWDTIEYVNKESWKLSGVMFGTLALDIAGVR